MLFAAPMADPQEYEQVVIARNLLAGDGFAMAWPYQPVDSARAALWASDPTPHPSAFMPPFVPAVAALVFSVTGSGTTGILALLILQSLVGAAVPWLVYRIARRMASERASLLAAAWSLLYLPGLLSSATPSGAVWYAVGGLVVVDVAQEVLRTQRRYWLLGAAIGLLALMRSEFVALGVVLCAVPLLQRRWKGALVAAAMLFVVISPWVIRNTVEFGKPVGMISHPWREIWRGANPYASGSGYAADGVSIWEGDRYPEIVARLDALPVTQTYEVEADQIFRNEATSYITADPLRWVVLGFKKALMLWTIDPYYPKAKSVLYVVPTLLTGLTLLLGLALAIRTLLRSRSWTSGLTPLVIVCLGLTGVFAVTYVLPRYQTYVFTMALPLIALVADLLPRRWLNASFGAESAGH